MKTLSIIGAGSVGKTLGKLFFDRQIFTIGDIVNSSLQSSQDAVAFVGSGNACAAISEMRNADIFMLSVPDQRIQSVCENLGQTNLLRRGDIVFHCSGALSSSLLSTASECGALVASIHPIMSFADCSAAAMSFSGTFCGVEGDELALNVLISAFEKLAARIVKIDSENKIFYHAGVVVVCNYLYALMHLGLKTFKQADIMPEQALQFMEPLVRGTIENVFKLGPAQALTGPIARGDKNTVDAQCKAFESWRTDYGDLYKALGRVALELAYLQGRTPAEKLSEIEKIFSLERL